MQIEHGAKGSVDSTEQSSFGFSFGFPPPGLHRRSQKHGKSGGADENRTLRSTFPKPPCETRSCPVLARKHGRMSIPFGSTGFRFVPSSSPRSRHNGGTREATRRHRVSVAGGNESDCSSPPLCRTAR